MAFLYQRKLLLKLFIFTFVTLSSQLLIAQTQVVTESDIARQVENTPPTKNWVGYTRLGTPPTALMFVNGPGKAPLGCGSVHFNTLTSAEKAFLFNYDHIGTKLTDIHNISYYTYRTSGTGSQVASLNIEVDYNGAAPGGFTTLVFEPVYNTNQGTVVNGTWQEWDAYKGGNAKWWSTQAIPGVCARACFVTWNTIISNNPDATVLGGVGINQGSGNPGLISAVDAFTFDDATYNFEPGVDSDGDEQGDGCDLDDDNDGIPDSQDCDPLNKKNDKVIVCHNGNEICVSKNAVDAHVKHGDYVGPCHTAEITRPEAFKKENIAPEGNAVTLRNYPNPFVDKTNISFTIPFDSKVTIKLYDMTGRERKVLLNANRSAGTHNLEFSPNNLIGGTYYYTLTAISGEKKFIETKKMSLLK